MAACEGVASGPDDVRSDQSEEVEESFGAGGTFGGRRIGGDIRSPHPNGSDSADLPQGAHLLDCGAQVAVLGAEVPGGQGVQVQRLDIEVLQRLLQLVVDVPVGVGVRRGASDFSDLAAGQESSVRVLPQEAPQKSLSSPGAVVVGCVQEVGAELHGATQTVKERAVVLVAGATPR